MPHVSMLWLKFLWFTTIFLLLLEKYLFQLWVTEHPVNECLRSSRNDARLCGNKDQAFQTSPCDKCLDPWRSLQGALKNTSARLHWLHVYGIYNNEILVKSCGLAGHHVYHVAACWALHCSHKGPSYGWATCSPEASWLSPWGVQDVDINHYHPLFIHDFIPCHDVQHLSIKILPPPRGHQGPACPRHAKTRHLVHLWWCSWIVREQNGLWCWRETRKGVESIVLHFQGINLYTKIENKF